MDHPNQEWFLQNQDLEVLDLQIYPPARVKAAILLVSIICKFRTCDKSQILRYYKFSQVVVFSYILYVY